MPSRFGRFPGPGMARAFEHHGFQVAATSIHFDGSGAFLPWISAAG